MPEEIELPFSNNIFIDTGIFIHEAFQLENSSIFKTLINFAKEQKLKILLVDITDNEVINSLENDQSKTFNNINSAIKQTNKIYSQINKADTRILKHISEFNDLMRNFKIFVDKYKTQDGISDINDKHSDFLKRAKDEYSKFLIDANVEKIDTDPNCIQNVFNKYFQKIAPFNKKKKNEFPDAFVLETILSWCKKNRETAYLISKDTDWREFANNEMALKYESSLTKIVSLYLRQEENLKQLITFTDKLIEDNKEGILEEIKDVLSEIDSYNYDIDYGLSPEDHYCGAPDYEISSVEVEDALEFIEIELVQIDENSAIYNILTETLLNVDYYLEDYSRASYDSEDKTYFNVETEEFTKTYKVGINVEVEISYTYNQPDSFNLMTITPQDKIEIPFYESEDDE